MNAKQVILSILAVIKTVVKRSSYFISSLSVPDTFSIIGISMLFSGLIIQYGSGIALIVSGSILLLFSILPYLKREKNDS